MPAIRLFPHQGSGLAFDLKEILVTLGEQARAAQWIVEKVAPQDEELQCYGLAYEELTQIFETGTIISGARLLEIAANIDQMIWGQFRTVDQHHRKRIRIVAFDSTWWDIDTDDEDAAANLRRAFPWASNHEATSASVGRQTSMFQGPAEPFPKS